MQANLLRIRDEEVVQWAEFHQLSSVNPSKSQVESYVDGTKYKLSILSPESETCRQNW